MLNANGPTPGYTRRQKLLDALVPDRLWRRLMRSSVRHLHGPERLASRPDELVVVCLVRDGEPYIEQFVEHYLNDLGARHIVFLDNGSADGTVELASRYKKDGVTVLLSKLPYREYSLLMKQYLIGTYGRGVWTLCVDVDELFDYPYSEAVGLGAFLGYLNVRGYTAVAAQMLDMFAEGPISASSGGSFLKEAHHFYDLREIREQEYGAVWRADNVLSNERIKILRGGIRKTLFGADAVLTKHPLVFPDGGVEPMVNSSHRVRGARIADLSGVLYHYKFVSGFPERVRRAVREENYSNLSKRYKQYLEVLQRNPDLTARGAGSRELSSTDDLLDAGFLVASESYREFARTPGEDAPPERPQPPAPRKEPEKRRATQGGETE
ncbi:Glycosyl transferase family 2 [Rubrobacter radiotolerans]|uniref:Glycosyl transferase family 2 n=1 Tax=Rubrobacter radiotolerans TaxID=42256 RepID=A0A023X1E4_RUBRA|nr:glycosyltransferase family 2 protein [Rubrobacter radiotolerans]AHY46133.1 Glycosyl transferase family 2 [Rubrobacter radiotolerans]MDX5893543.1 glycosyltransferase family 2 protein [Rubrobacter radiotolerans]SMC03952.1 Glycosyltransferase involved in cell wall bisynthesis [Rubrobacter radiotolerans DSM 5868]